MTKRTRLQLSRLQMGKSGALRVTTVAAARALVTQNMAAGHRETPDVGTPRVKVTVHAPKVAAFLERRTTALARESLALLIANDLAALLVKEMPGQSDALKALTVATECAVEHWLRLWGKGAKR